jgi:hypothetical protein
MNANVMITNREYVETHYAIEAKVNKELLQYADKFYLNKLSHSEEQRLLALSLKDKQWLLEQYKEEVEFNTSPDLDNLY